MEPKFIIEIGYDKSTMQFNICLIDINKIEYNKNNKVQNYQYRLFIISCSQIQDQEYIPLINLVFNAKS